MDAKWNEFTAACQQALADLVEGRPEAFKALFSRREDVVIMGAHGGVEVGWDEVSKGIDWASRVIEGSDRTIENIITTVGDDLALTVDLEHMVKRIGDEVRPWTVRCTQVYRVEDGEWKIILRHGDELLPPEQRMGPPGGGPPGGGPPGGGPPGGGPPGGGPPGGGPPGGGPPGGGPPGGGPPGPR